MTNRIKKEKTSLRRILSESTIAGLAIGVAHFAAIKLGFYEVHESVETIAPFLYGAMYGIVNGVVRGTGEIIHRCRTYD